MLWLAFRQPAEFSSGRRTCGLTRLCCSDSFSDAPFDSGASARFFHDVGKAGHIQRDLNRIRLQMNTSGWVGEMTEQILERLKFFAWSKLIASPRLVKQHMAFKDVKQKCVRQRRKTLSAPAAISTSILALHKLDCLACHGESVALRFFAWMS